MSEFKGTRRYEVRRQLGEGAFGVVYEAFDRERRLTLALKVLSRLNPQALYRFKREFRALSDFVHPNLVSLGELVSEGETWFFTMEYVAGTSFIEHVRPGAPLHDSQTIRSDAAASPRLKAPAEPASAAAGPVPPRPSVLDEGKLRAALRQLADGVLALHEAGRLHRDLKPSNVLVSPEGRVVILDFGLTREIAPDSLDASVEQQIIGTPAYMAPEQAAARPVTEASDWYAVGSILYEALAGRPPFKPTQSLIDLVIEKQTRDPPPPAAIGAQCPADLADLCMELLARDPAARPTGREVLRRLGGPPGPGLATGLFSGAGAGAGGSGPEAGPAAYPSIYESGRFTFPESSATGQPAVSLPGAPPVPLVGRARPLAALDEALAATRAGRSVTVFVRGLSGMGKSALVRRFLEDAAGRDGAIVLRGRCYERESVPYKALDSLVDALTQYLLRLTPVELAPLLPRDPTALARLFPVLKRVEEVASAKPRSAETPDPQELRRRASSALRALLARLADRRLLILFIDDLQWGDADSAALLLDLLEPPDPPPLLLVAAFRSEDEERSPLLKALRRREGGASGRAEVRELEVGPLGREEARELALALIAADADGAPPGEKEARATAIARESGGNPFFVIELLRYAREAARVGPAAAPHEVSLDRVVRARVALLPEGTQRLLEVVAVAGIRLDESVVARAAGLEGREARAALAALAGAHLVRIRGGRGRDRIEPYHDRIRDAVVSGLRPEALREHHARLAAALETWGRGDPEVLALHFKGAGDIQKAGVYTVAAAANAADALAFERASSLYRQAVSLRSTGGAPPAELHGLRVRLGDALANAGRGPEAAYAYVEAAGEVGGDEALELWRRGADQLLRSGRVDEGLAAIEGVLAAMGMRLAPTPRRALLSLLFRRAHIRLRGLGYRERAAADVPPSDLVRIDTCWSVAAGLSNVDTIRGADFQTRHLLLALRAGEPYRVARALAMEAAYASSAGGRGRARVEKLVAQVQGLVTRLDNPHALGVATAAQGVCTLLMGEWAAARDGLERAVEIYRDRCTGVGWERATAELFLLWSLVYLGEVKELKRRLPALIDDARRRGDLYAATNIVSGIPNIVWLADDDPKRARDEALGAMSGWSRRGYHLQHYRSLMAIGQAQLYSGDAPALLARIHEMWPQLKRALFLGFQFIRLELLHLRARAALATAVAPAIVPLPASERERLLREAGRDARDMERERMPWSDALARLLRAGIAGAEGRIEDAASFCAGALSDLGEAGMLLHAAAARRRLGELRGGDGGRALVAGADAAFAEQGIVNPARMTAMLAPGFGG